MENESLWFTMILPIAMSLSVDFPVRLGDQKTTNAPYIDEIMGLWNLKKRA